jgi:hypothetical protein
MSTKVTTIDGYEDVPANNEKALLKALAKQPVSVAIEASGQDFQLYASVISQSLITLGVTSAISLRCRPSQNRLPFKPSLALICRLVSSHRL